MKVRTWLAVLVALILMGMVVSGVSAQTGTQPLPSDDQVNAVAKQLYCPVCENIPLDVCPTQACAQWRDLIRQKLAEGQTKEQIKQYFAAQYGDRVLAEPPRQGLNWLVWARPDTALTAITSSAKTRARVVLRDFICYSANPSITITLSTQPPENPTAIVTSPV